MMTSPQSLMLTVNISKHFILRRKVGVSTRQQVCNYFTVCAKRTTSIVKSGSPADEGLCSAGQYSEEGDYYL